MLFRFAGFVHCSGSFQYMPVAGTHEYIVILWLGVESSTRCVLCLVSDKDSIVRSKCGIKWCSDIQGIDGLCGLAMAVTVRSVVLVKDERD